MEDLQKLEMEELQNIGGGGFWGPAALTFAAYMFKEIYNDWEGHKKAFKEGWEAAKNN